MERRDFEEWWCLLSNTRRPWIATVGRREWQQTDCGLNPGSQSQQGDRWEDKEGR